MLASLPLHQVNGLSNLLKTNLEKGIQGDDTDLVKRRNAFGSNIYPRKKGRTFWVNFITILIF
jgi:Ca2+-transporting ATPase